MSLTKYILVAAFTTSAMPANAAPERYVIDPMHTYPSIEFLHMGLSVWRGKFNKTSGEIRLDRAAKSGTVQIAVDISSINFGLAAMDEKARSDDFFDAARFPTASYRGRITFAGDRPASVDGEVTIRGITRPATLRINLFNCMPHPMLKREVCGADAEGELNWSEYGMKMSQYGQGAAGKVRLRIQVEAIKAQ
jgi:polyisoprenoid-binding protein YceI